MATNEISLNTTVSRNPDVAWRILGNFLIAITPSSNTVHRFNKTGADLWKFIENDNVTISELVTSLENLYDINRSQAEKDVLGFFREVVKKGIVLGT